MSLSPKKGAEREDNPGPPLVVLLTSPLHVHVHVHVYVYVYVYLHVLHFDLATYWPIRPRMPSTHHSPPPRRP